MPLSLWGSRSLTVNINHQTNDLITLILLLVSVFQSSLINSSYILDNSPTSCFDRVKYRLFLTEVYLLISVLLNKFFLYCLDGLIQIFFYRYLSDI